MSKQNLAKKQSEPAQKIKVKVILPKTEEGYYMLEEYEISLETLKKEGSLLDKTLPDIYAVFKDQMINKTRDIFGL